MGWHSIALHSTAVTGTGGLQEQDQDQVGDCVWGVGRAHSSLDHMGHTGAIIVLAVPCPLCPNSQCGMSPILLILYMPFLYCVVPPVCHILNMPHPKFAISVV